MWLYVWMDRPVYPEEEMDEENVVEDESELTLNKMEDDIAVVRTSACYVCGCGVGGGGWYRCGMYICLSCVWVWGGGGGGDIAVVCTSVCHMCVLLLVCVCEGGGGWHHCGMYISLSCVCVCGEGVDIAVVSSFACHVVGGWNCCSI